MCVFTFWVGCVKPKAFTNIAFAVASFYFRLLHVWTMARAARMKTSTRMPSIRADIQYLVGWDDEQKRAWRLRDGAVASAKEFTKLVLDPGADAADEQAVVARF